jgi:hypothetical protein
MMGHLVMHVMGIKRLEWQTCAPFPSGINKSVSVRKYNAIVNQRADQTWKE